MIWGEPIATLRASEPGIYGRFGYGVASRFRVVEVRPGTVADAVPRDGQVRLLEPAEFEKRVREVYDRIGLSRPGMIARPDSWWARYRHRLATGDNLVAAVHTGDDGDDGFVVWEPKPGTSWLTHQLQVADLHAANPSALATL
ncbi:hypothetical protein GCM10012275_47530 [Longimycelium tulufanense]|uniref:Eis-like acetyltransferase domain-containing protein n=1 Tax=Longimycelium tulufanense TaxID=907463 RepID=A0A8J3FYF1_9PSEU|nr:hypothetical protein [Longimycelium tulufanense]GGM71554.1 hypothetical protein GCM10012275_47530 [Longimycelium tulufanense]